VIEEFVMVGETGDFHGGEDSCYSLWVMAPWRQR